MRWNATCWAALLVLLSPPPYGRGPSQAQGQERLLRVCADPNNMPFSNARKEGFENRLASLIAGELKLQVDYTWWPQRRGFVRNTLKANRCDLILGVPAGYEMVQTTTPYYRSSYAFVTRRDSKLDVRSFDDPRLKKARIGVHVVGDDYAAVPPMQALAMRGIIDNMRGYSIYGSYAERDPPRALIEAVAQRDVDLAVAWGPLAGYFANKSAVPLRVHAIDDRANAASPPMAFDIAMGVRRGDSDLAKALERILVRKRAQIRRLLASYHVPLLSRR